MTARATATWRRNVRDRKLSAASPEARAIVPVAKAAGRQRFGRVEERAMAPVARLYRAGPNQPARLVDTTGQRIARWLMLRHRR
jgi:hypothetical protein